MRRSRSALVLGAACASLVLVSTSGAVATSEGRESTRGAAEQNRILYLQRDNPTQFSSYLGTIAYDGSNLDNVTGGPGLVTAALSEDRLHAATGWTSSLQIATPTFGSATLLNGAASDTATQIAMTPTTNVLVAGTLFDGAPPSKVVALGPGDGDPLVTLLDDEDFQAFPFWVLGADDDRALVMAQTDRFTFLTVALDGSGFQEWEDWAGAWQAPRNGPVVAVKAIADGYRLLRLAPGADATTRIADLPADRWQGGSWSARGNRFVLAGQWGGKDRLVLVNRAGTKVSVLKKQPGAGAGFAAPALSSDGKLLAYHVVKNGNPGTAGLWVRDLGRARSCRVLAWSDVSYPRPAFSPDSSRVVVSGTLANDVVGSVRLDRPGRSLQELDLPQSELVGFVGGPDQPIDAKPCPR